MPDGPLEVTLEYTSHPHLAQIYTGFQRLEAQGALRCHWLRATPRALASGAVTSVVVNGRVPITYDTADGLNWVAGGREQNLEHFRKTGAEGFYFKRSFDPALVEVAPTGCSVRPLGLNYYVSPDYVPAQRPLRARLEGALRDSPLVRRLAGVNGATFTEPEFTGVPQLTGPDRVLMCTKLWDPSGATSQHQRDERLELNERRIDLVRSLRKEFGARFTGGMQSDSYSRRVAPEELLLPQTATEKHAYLAAMRSHSICVTTTGLHGSIGWRLGEYVSAARAVVTEPLRYDVGEDFRAGENYLAAPEVDGLLGQVDLLLSDRRRVVAMMDRNRRYHASYLRPDSLVLNTLLTALGLRRAASDPHSAAGQPLAHDGEGRSRGDEAAHEGQREERQAHESPRQE